MRWMRLKSSYVVLTLLSFCLDSTAQATPIRQVDIITLGGTVWTGDAWTLQLTGPIATSVTYTTTDADVVGCNICNTMMHWGAAINAAPILAGFLTATYAIWDGVSPVPPPEITLTANVPGVPFLASVSVVGPCDPLVACEPISVSIVTQTAASSVPEPNTLTLFGAGFLGLIALRRRKAKGRWS